MIETERARVKVACLQLSPPPESSKAKRVEHAVSLIEDLPPVDLAVLPELWPVGYFRFHRYEQDAESLGGNTVTTIREVAARRNMFILGGSFVERAEEGKLQNTAFLVDPDGNVAMTYRKMHVFGYHSREAALLTAGDSVSVAKTPFVNVGATTCYDLRFPELYRELVDGGAEIVLVSSAWPKARLEHWSVLNRARAIENQAYVVACNMAGIDDGTSLAGSSMVVDPWGEIVARADKEEKVLFAELDMKRLRDLREEFPVLKDRCIGSRVRPTITLTSSPSASAERR